LDVVDAFGSLVRAGSVAGFLSPAKREEVAVSAAVVAFAVPTMNSRRWMVSDRGDSSFGLMGQP
jgi:hypothetical protein